MFTLSISISVSPKAIGELVSLLEEKGGTPLVVSSVKKALEKFIEFEAESIASDPIAYASQIFTNRSSSCELQALDMDYGLHLAEMQAQEEAEIQRYIDEADYRSLVNSF
jgi:hypothetical protein